MTTDIAENLIISLSARVCRITTKHPIRVTQAGQSVVPIYTESCKQNLIFFNLRVFLYNVCRLASVCNPLTLNSVRSRDKIKMTKNYDDDDDDDDEVIDY